MVWAFFLLPYPFKLLESFNNWIFSPKGTRGIPDGQKLKNIQKQQFSVAQRKEKRHSQKAKAFSISQKEASAGGTGFFVSTDRVEVDLFHTYVFLVNIYQYFPSRGHDCHDWEGDCHTAVTLHTAHCTLYTVHSTMKTSHFTLYTINFSLYQGRTIMDQNSNINF